mgnify:CR=1 FL=1
MTSLSPDLCPLCQKPNGCAMEWAKATGDHFETDGDDLHRDCNGAVLQTGDSVTLIKSLDVKGSQINAKIGAVVKNIRLVADNTSQIEIGRAHV